MNVLSYIRPLHDLSGVSGAVATELHITDKQMCRRTLLKMKVYFEPKSSACPRYLTSPLPHRSCNKTVFGVAYFLPAKP